MSAADIIPPEDVVRWHGERVAALIAERDQAQADLREALDALESIRDDYYHTANEPGYGDRGSVYARTADTILRKHRRAV